MINSPGAISIYPQFDRLAGRISICSLFFAPNESQLVQKDKERNTFLFYAGGLWKYPGQQVPNRAGVRTAS